MSEATLTLHHQDGDLVYRVAPERETGFLVDGGRLSFSVRAECVGRDQWPTVFFVAGHDLPLAAEGVPVVGQRLAVTHEGGTATGRCCAYYGEHAADVEVTVEVLAVADDRLDLAVVVVTEDVVYAGEKARPTRATARIGLARVEREHLWDPRDREPTS